MAIDYSKTAKWTFYAGGAILIIVGALCLLQPLLAVFSLAVCMGIGFIIGGVNNLVPYLTTKGEADRPKWFLALGVIDIVVGVFFLTHIGLAIFTVTTMVGVWFLLVGCIRGYMSFKLRAAGIEKWWLLLVSAVLMLLLSALMLSRPVAAGFGAAWIVGTTLMAAGAMMIGEARLIYTNQT